jgi:hypothetical protein
MTFSKNLASSQVPSSVKSMRKTDISCVSKELEIDGDEFSDYSVDGVDMCHAMATIEYELNAHNYVQDEVQISPPHHEKRPRIDPQA